MNDDYIEILFQCARNNKQSFPQNYKINKLIEDGLLTKERWVTQEGLAKLKARKEYLRECRNNETFIEIIQELLDRTAFDNPPNTIREFLIDDSYGKNEVTSTIRSTETEFVEATRNDTNQFYFYYTLKGKLFIDNNIEYIREHIREEDLVKLIPFLDYEQLAVYLASEDKRIRNMAIVRTKYLEKYTNDLKWKMIEEKPKLEVAYK